MSKSVSYQTVSYQNGKTRSAFIELQPEETEYQKAVREHLERQEREEQEAQAAAEQPKPEPKPLNVGDAARMILNATAGMDPKERGIFVELLAKGEV